MKYWNQKLLVCLVINLCIFNSAINAQEISLSDWDVIDPWEDFCTDLILDNEEEKLMTNVGSKAFTWLTGTKEQAEYEPIGELANYFGFAKFRNEIRDSSDNPLADENLRGTSWLVVLENLDENQREVLYNAAIAQTDDFSSFLEERVQLIGGIYGLKDNQDIVLDDAMTHVDAMSTHEANISIISAHAFGEVSISLSDNQKELFAQIRKGDIIVSEMVGTGPYANEITTEIDQFDSFQKDLLKETASKFLSYETGSLEDAIFLPSGKIGNFFGFAHYRYEERADVSRKQAADLLFSVLTEQQEEIIKCLTKQIYDFEQGYIEAREQFITDVYPLRSGEEIDENLVLEDYINRANDEGRLGVVQAIYFDFLERMLSDEQIEELKVLRENTGNDTTNNENITKSEDEIYLYPNPFIDNINLMCATCQTGVVGLNLFDLQGQLILSIKNSANTENRSFNLITSDISKGLYFYTIRHSNDQIFNLVDSGFLRKL